MADPIAAEESSNRNLKDLSGFIKYFSIRLIQAVVQSRSGQKVRTECQPASERTDWFNVRVEELGEVTSEIRKATGGVYPPAVDALCLHFELLTADGAMLPLESWCVAYDSSQCDPTVNVRSQLYHQMGTLLKSAVAASRVTPAYRYYVGKQAADSFVICYSITHGHPLLEQLGDGRRSVQLGRLPSPFGTLTLELHYRTKMVLSESDVEPPVPTHTSTRVPPLPSISTTVIAGARTRTPPASPFGEPSPSCNSTFSTSPGSMDLPWFTATASPQKQHRHSVTFDVGPAQSATSSDGSAGSQVLANRNSSGSLFKMDMSTESPKNQSVSNEFAVGRASNDEQPFGSSSLPDRYPGDSLMQKRKTSFPFEALLSSRSSPALAKRSESVCEEPSQPVSRNESREADDNRNTDVASSVVNAATPATPIPVAVSNELIDDDEADLESSDDSFVKISASLFANPKEISSDLGAFVSSFKSAPQRLRSFDVPPTSDDDEGMPVGVRMRQRSAGQESLESVPGQLEQFEARQVTFDRFVKSLTLETSDEEH